MPLITKILKPEEFNSTIMAHWLMIALANIAAQEYGEMPTLQELVDAQQYVLDRLKLEGVIG